MLNCLRLMTNWLMAMYNFKGKEKHNTPRKIAFRQTNLVKLKSLNSLIKPRNTLFTTFAFFWIGCPQINPIYHDLLTLTRAHDVT